MTTLTNSGRFQQIYTIPEAACLWAGVPLDQLQGAAYLSPCVPLIVGRPDVSERAQTLMAACGQRVIEFAPVYVSEDGPELLERRTLRKEDLLAWLKANFAGADAKLGGGPPPEPKRELENVKFLSFEEARQRVGISRAQVYRERKNKDLPYPAPDTESPNRWKLSTITDYIEQKAKKATGDPDI
jgi:predicted DNA-binding transcriptional regulator AlpA